MLYAHPEERPSRADRQEWLRHHREHIPKLECSRLPLAGGAPRRREERQERLMRPALISDLPVPRGDACHLLAECIPPRGNSVSIAFTFVFFADYIHALMLICKVHITYAVCEGDGF